MTAREDRVHQLDISQDNQSAAGGPRRGRAPAGVGRDTAAAARWRVIDGWVRDGKIRRDALIALALVLITVVGSVVALTGALGPLVDGLAGNPVARVVAGGMSLAGMAGYGGMRLHRRRARRRAPARATQGSPPDDGARG